jgi:hypothetical protein
VVARGSDTSLVHRRFRESGRGHQSRRCRRVSVTVRCRGNGCGLSTWFRIQPLWWLSWQRNVWDWYVITRLALELNGIAIDNGIVKVLRKSRYRVLLSVVTAHQPTLLI